MTRGPIPILPIALGRILQSKQTIHSDFPTLVIRSRDTVRRNHFFMDLRAAARPTRVAKILGAATLIAIEDGSLC